MDELNKLEREWREYKKCPQCHAEYMMLSRTAYDMNTHETCKKCGFKRPYIYRHCKICNKVERVSKFVVTQTTVLHKDADCHRKSLGKTYRKNKPNPLDTDSSIRNESMEREAFFDFLATLTFEEIDSLWHEKVWLDPSDIPGTSRLSEDCIRENIEKVRRAKYKNASSK